MAMKFSSLTTLIPDGYNKLMDVPWTIMYAIQYAMMILSWSSLPEDERPPKEIWRNDEKLKEWFKGINDRKYPSIKNKSKHYDYYVTSK